jgi:hypothetical protein
VISRLLAAVLLAVQPPPDAGVTLRWDGPGRSAVIEAEAAGANLFFEVKVRGHEKPLWFTIDTGSSYTFLDARAAAELKLETAGSSTVHGAGGGAVPVVLARGVAFVIPGLETSGHEVRITDLSGLEGQFGHRVDGFFGYDFLRALTVTIDPDRARVTVADPAVFRHAGAGEVLPLRFGGRTGRWIYVPGTIKVPGHPPERSDFFVDSGSGDAVNHPLIRKSTGPLRETRTGVGLGDAGSGVIGRIEWFRLGRFRLEGAPSVCCGAPGTEAQIGSAVLSRFVVTYDYVRKRLIVRPGRRLNDPFEAQAGV